MLISRTDDWEWQQVTHNEPGSPSTFTVPTTGWEEQSPGPFGEQDNVDEPIGLAPNTDWDRGTSFWIRRTLTTQEGQPILMRGLLDNGALFYLDGTFIGGINRTNETGSALVEWKLIIPESLVPTGSQTLAIYLMDQGIPGANEATYFSIEAEYLPPFEINKPVAPLRETLEWLTDVLEADDGTEVRDEIRNNPRHSFQLNYDLDGPDQERLNNLIWAKSDEEWLVPFWHEAEYIGAVTADELELSADTQYSNYGDLVLIWEAKGSWQVIGIEAKTSDTLDLTSYTQAFTAAYVMPIHPARLPAGPNRSAAGHYSTYTLPMELIDHIAVSSSASATQFEGEDAYTDPILFNGDTTPRSIQLSYQGFDPAKNTPEYYSHRTNNRISKEHRLFLETDQEKFEARQWIYRRAGRFRAYYQPTFEDDFELLSTGNLTTTLLVRNKGSRNFMLARDKIAIETSSGWLLRTITASSISSGNVQLTLDSSIATSAENVKRISYLGLNRLSADRVELLHTQGGFLEVAIPVTEIAP